MAEISLKIKSDFEKAAADFKSLDMSSESFKKSLAKLQTQMSDGSIDKFMAKNKLNAAAITATKGATAGLSAELAGLQREMSNMIKKGLDPMSPALDKMKSRMSAIQGQIPQTSSTFGGLAGAVSSVGMALGGAGIAYKMFDIAKSSIQAAAAMEQQQVAFTTMLGSAEKANALLADMQQFAETTPFQFNDIVDAGKRMIAFGFSAQEVIPKLRALGDVSAGLSVPLGDMAYLFGTIKTQGRAMTQDLNQFANRGVPIYEELAKVLGVSTNEVKKFAEQGKIGFKEIDQVFQNLTSNGGKFAGLMDAQSKTLSGQWSNFNDQLSKTAIIIGNQLSPTAKALLTTMTQILASGNAQGQQIEINTRKEAERLKFADRQRESYIAQNGFLATGLNILNGTAQTDVKLQQINADKAKTMMLIQAHQNGTNVLTQQQLGYLRSNLEELNRMELVLKNQGKGWFDVNSQVMNVVKTIQDANKAQGGSGGVKPTPAGGGSKKSETQIMQDQLVKMAGFENEIYAQRVKAAEDFYLKKAEAEVMWGDSSMQWQFDQASLIAANDKLTFDQKLAAMKALENATQKHSQKVLQTQLQFGSQVLGSTGDLLTNIQTVMKNAGKESKAMAYALKALAIAQAGINTALAVTKTLADGGPFPLNVINAAIIGAAGAAQVAAIATTPIKAETGLQNYTVPDIRSNRNDSAPIMAQGGETVSVTPRGEDSNQVTSVNISIGETQLFSIIQRGINTGQINVSNKNVGAAVFAR